jgi:hypothetical protein
MNVTPPSPATPWHLEPARPGDRGAVARLVEAAVADSPALAPEVASGAMRATVWLVTPRPAHAVIAIAGAERRVVGYAASGASGADRLLLHPTLGPDAGTALADALREELSRVAAAGPDVPVSASVASSTVPAAAVAGDPADVVVDDLVEVHFRDPLPPPTLRRRALGPVGALAIGAAAVLGVVAVQVGVGPLESVLPFLDRDRPPVAAPGPDRPEPTRPAPPLSVAGPTLAPVAQASADPGAPSTTAPTAAPPTGAPTAGPTDQPTDGPGPTTPPAEDRGAASALLDPVLESVVGAVDSATGHAAEPLTSSVVELTDATTDVVDDVLELLSPGTVPALP